MPNIRSFSAGPAKLPEEIVKPFLEAIQTGVGTGRIPLLELPDRGPDFQAILGSTKELVRKLYQVPDNFSILVIPGGATLQFAMLGLNLRGSVMRVQVIETDFWTTRAVEEMEKSVSVEIAASSRNDRFRSLPHIGPDIQIADEEAIFITSNNTAAGTQWRELPLGQTGVRIVDASSDIFVRHFDFDQVDLVFACAQKTFGVPGHSIALIRRALLDRLSSELPGVLSYRAWDHSPQYCTLPVVNITLSKLVLDELANKGGVSAAIESARMKSSRIYSFLEGSSAFVPFADTQCRSTQNATFHCSGGPDADAHVAALAAAEGFIGLKGHPATGGLRVSLYPGVTLEDVGELISFLGSVSVERLAA